MAKKGSNVMAGLMGQITNADKPTTAAAVELPELSVADYGGTQGRKGAKMRRINVAMSDDALTILKRESRKAGLTYGEFLHVLLTTTYNK